MTHVRRLVIAIAGLLTMICPQSMASPWPLFQDTACHKISALYGLYQYGYTAGVTLFMHSGVDLVAPPGTPVYAIKAGYVKAILTTLSPDNPRAFSFWRVTVGDSAGAAECDAYMYAHLDKNTIAVVSGQEVTVGQYLGDVVDWLDSSTVEHLHLSKVRYAGNANQWVLGYNNWRYIANPLDDLTPSCDTVAPVIEPALGQQLLAFCDNETGLFFDEGASVGGYVDIVARIYDYHNWFMWKNAPYRIEFCIKGDSSLAWQSAFCLNGPLGSYGEMTNLVLVTYSHTPPCSTLFVWNQEQAFYYIITNSDGDSTIELDDAAYCWETPFFHNGDYNIVVRAFDQSGNTDLDSMIVTVANIFALSGQISLADGNPDRSGAVVTVVGSGQKDTTDIAGNFTIPLVGGGVQSISIFKYGYEQADTTAMMNEARQISIVLESGVVVCGDPNGDLIVNIKDITYLIAFLYKWGPPPVMDRVADVNSDGQINIKDITYLINYLYKSGPIPVCP